jgi:hypothetical protein
MYRNACALYWQSKEVKAVGHIQLPFFFNNINNNEPELYESSLCTGLHESQSIYNSTSYPLLSTTTRVHVPCTCPLLLLSQQQLHQPSYQLPAHERCQLLSSPYWFNKLDTNHKPAPATATAAHSRPYEEDNCNKGLRPRHLCQGFTGPALLLLLLLLL